MVAGLYGRGNDMAKDDRDRQIVSNWASATNKGNGAGINALIFAVIIRACVDYVSNNVQQAGDAAAYFLGDVYREHLQILGMPEEYYPEILMAWVLREDVPSLWGKYKNSFGGSGGVTT